MAAGRLRLTLYRKFLLVLVPSFVVLAAAGVVLAGRLDTRSATEALALRVGSLAACVAATLGRHDALGERGLAEDLLGTFGTDRAVLCAELRARDDAEPARASWPAVVGCKRVGPSARLTLPVGDDAALLSIRYSDAEIAAQARSRALVLIAIVLAALAAALASASIGFRLIVGRRLARLHRAMNERAEEGPRARLDPGRGDELADISEAFNQLMEREQAREAALVQRNLELSQQSRRDTLTGLFNRRHFEEWAAASWPALRGQAALIAIIDVDRFKRINDRFGHAVGDEVLVALARRLGAALRPEDLLLRWGGEEMVALALGPRAPGDLAARLLEVVDSDPVASSAGPLPVSVSIGLARLPLQAGELELPIERALVLADRALYAAKNAGRDCAIVIESLQVAGRAELADVEDNLWKAADFGLVTLRQIQGGAGSKALLAPAARVALGAE